MIDADSPWAKEPNEEADALREQIGGLKEALVKVAEDLDNTAKASQIMSAVLGSVFDVAKKVTTLDEEEVTALKDILVMGGEYVELALAGKVLAVEWDGGQDLHVIRTKEEGE